MKKETQNDTKFKLVVTGLFLLIVFSIYSYLSISPLTQEEINQKVSECYDEGTVPIAMNSQFGVSLYPIGKIYPEPIDVTCFDFS